MEFAGCGPFGHAGMYIGNGKVIHMQISGICQGSFSSNFSKNYWGAISQGDSKAAEKRIKTANSVKDKKPNFDLYAYKLYPYLFRCDGFVEYCFEQAPGGNIVTDWIFFSISPRDQWQSSRVSRSDTTTLGTSRYKNTLVSDYPKCSSTAAVIAQLAPLMI